MNVDFGLKIDKKDVLTIVLLCIVFFSIASVNLGYTTYPTTITMMSVDQSFIVDLGSATNVKSMLFILFQGEFNGTISTGSPGNWTTAVTVLYPSSGEDWCKYVQYNGQNEVPVGQTTQYLKVNFGSTGGYQTQLLQVAVLDQNNQLITIKSITNAGEGNPDVNNLINDQAGSPLPRRLHG